MKRSCDKAKTILTENIKKLSQASKDQLGLNSINGIKALSMILILAGHTILFTYGGPTYNPEFMDEVKFLNIV